MKIPVSLRPACLEPGFSSNFAETHSLSVSNNFPAQFAYTFPEDGGKAISLLMRLVNIST